MSEIFARFEVNREPRWPILLRLLVASLVLHLTGLACAIYVPAVRDAFNIAAFLSDTNFVDRPYVHTQIGDDVQIVQLEKFHYPEGYFATVSGIIAEPMPTPLPWLGKVTSSARSKAAQPEPCPSSTPAASPSPVPANNTNATASASPAVSPEQNAN